MDALFARYFDGDLNENEAREFLAAIAAEPRLEKELRDYERMLAIGKSLPAPKAPAGFTERVMRRITLEEKSGTADSQARGAASVVDSDSRGFGAGRGSARRRFEFPPLGTRWAGVAVAAVAIAIAYIGGVYTARNRAVTPAGTVEAESGLRFVRLAYVPTDPSVEKVTVVGSFNNWNSEATPLSRQDGVWSTILVLAPGSYEYMFLENSMRWVTDPLAVQTRDDGFGGANAILDVEA
jgi:hypothetical protein